MNKKKLQRVRGVFAFWRYDLFPYVLGGTVAWMGEKGGVFTEEYGYGYGFTPFKLMPAPSGKKLLAKLEALRAEKKIAEDAFHREWDEKLFALMPEARNPDFMRHQKEPKKTR